MRRILWHNFPARRWLWWHMTALPRRRHSYMDIASPIWTCSCGSSYPRSKA